MNEIIASLTLRNYFVSVLQKGQTVFFTVHESILSESHTKKFVRLSL
jgi:hypothetical protein